MGEPSRDRAPATTALGGSAAAATTGMSLLESGIWSGAGRILPQAYTLALAIVAARVLGPEGMGRQSYIGFVQVTVVMVVTAGLPVALMRHVGETLGRGEAGAVRALLAWALRIEALAALAGGAGLAASALAGSEPRGAWLFAAVACSMSVLVTVPGALLIGAQRWREASIAGLATGAFGTAATIAVLLAGGGITGMFAVTAATSVANLAWTSILARRVLAEMPAARDPAPELRRQTARYARVTSVSVLLTFVVWQRSEFFFLERYSSDAAIAFYSIAFSAFTVLALIPEAVYAVITPAVATLFGAGVHDRIRSGYSRALRLLLLLAFPLTAVGLATAPDSLRLVFGEEYRPTGQVVLVLLVPLPVVALVGAASSLLQGLGRARTLLAAVAVAALVNVALDLLLIPRYGAIGAALANLGGQLTAAVPLVVCAARAVGGVDVEWRAVARTALAAAAAGVAAWSAVFLVGGLAGVLLGLLAGALAFAGSGAILGVLSASDAAWIDAVAGPRLGAVGRSLVRLWARSHDVV